MANTAIIFKALAEESRLRILELLMQDEMCVCEIEECLKNDRVKYFTAFNSS